MSVTAFNMGAGGSSKIYFGNAIWSRNSTYGTDQSVYLTIPKGAIGLICTCSTNYYSCSFSAPSGGTVLISESTSGEARGCGVLVLLFTEALKSEAHTTFYYGSGSGCNFVMYPVMMK